MADKKRVAGTVDRVEGDIAVVVIRDPDDADSTREIYVDKKKLKRVDLKEGDQVTVLLPMIEEAPIVEPAPTRPESPPPLPDCTSTTRMRTMLAPM